MNTGTPLKALSQPSRPSRGGLHHSSLLLQRKCACGSPASPLTGECPACKSKKLLQTKLAIGASNDPLEQEADRVADQVIAAPGDAAISDSRPHIQRFTGQAAGQAATAPASVDSVLADSGRPLDAPLQQDMEQRFGRDFSQVRIHTGEAAEQSARDVNAKAYTVGNDVVFGAGQFAAGVSTKRRLLAHELTHVVQQSAATAPPLQRQPDSQADDSKEENVDTEADDPIDDYETGADNEVAPQDIAAADTEEDESFADAPQRLDNPPAPAAAGKRIVVKLPDTLVRFEGGKRISSWGISGGKPGHPTPTGNSFKIGLRDENHRSSSYGTCDGKKIGPDGARKCKKKGGTYVGADMHFYQQIAPAVGFHRGDPAVPSHGCIHVSGKNAETLWNWATTGTPVVVCSGSGCDSYLGTTTTKKKKRKP